MSLIFISLVWSPYLTGLWGTRLLLHCNAVTVYCTLCNSMDKTWNTKQPTKLPIGQFTEELLSPSHIPVKVIKYSRATQVAYVVCDDIPLPDTANETISVLTYLLCFWFSLINNNTIVHKINLDTHTWTSSYHWKSLSARLFHLQPSPSVVHCFPLPEKQNITIWRHMKLQLNEDSKLLSFGVRAGTRLTLATLVTSPMMNIVRQKTIDCRKTEK